MKIIVFHNQIINIGNPIFFLGYKNQQVKIKLPFHAMILIRFHLLFCTCFIFLFIFPNFFFLKSHNTYFLLRHIPGKCVACLNQEEKSMKKPGILDLFLHLLCLQPTFHLGLMLLFCFLKLSYPDIFLEVGGGGGSWLYVVLVSEAI